jgi:hypothetical protein
MLLPCELHGCSVCQQLWLRDKALAQKLSMHIIRSYVCVYRLPVWAEVTADLGLEGL